MEGQIEGQTATLEEEQQPDQGDVSIRDGFNLASICDLEILKGPLTPTAGQPLDIYVHVSLPRGYLAQQDCMKLLYRLASENPEQFFTFLDTTLVPSDEAGNPIELRRGESIMRPGEKFYFRDYPDLFSNPNGVSFNRTNLRASIPGKYILLARLRRKFDYNDFERGRPGVVAYSIELADPNVSRVPVSGDLKAPLAQKPAVRTPIRIPAGGIKMALKR
jgi:hypothetical protein